MTIRILGATLILVGCGYYGFFLAAAYRKETSCLASFIEMLDYFACELQYRSPPLAELFSGFAHTRKNHISDFCGFVSDEIERQICPNAKECIRAALQKRGNMPKETAAMLMKFGATLGMFNADGQLIEIRNTRNEAQHKLDQLLSNQDTKTKNYKTLGLCAGAAIAILFI